MIHKACIFDCVCCDINLRVINNSRFYKHSFTAKPVLPKQRNIEGNKEQLLTVSKFEIVIYLYKSECTYVCVYMFRHNYLPVNGIVSFPCFT
jgi:hypothetical protein